ncbi:HIT family protein [Leptospira fluminis]|uniref:HIT family protein n=1 Tax=Leptospira fluminis TaxID=2484979 RepID=UPI003CCC82B0
MPSEALRSDCPICIEHSSSSPSGFLFRSGDFLIRHCEPSKKIPGYLYVEPIAHRESYSEWSEKEFSEFGIALQKASEWILSRFSPAKIYTVLVSEKVAHMHFHLIPRYGETKGPEYIRQALEGMAQAPDGISFPKGN